MEVLVVVVIIGLLAAIALPAISIHRSKSAAARMANDFRLFGEQFQIFCMSNGGWPPDGYPSTIPTGMETTLPNSWTGVTGIGGRWDFDMGVFGIVAGVSVDGFTSSTATLVYLDEMIDDGNLATGTLRLTRGDHLTYVLEEE